MIVTLALIRISRVYCYASIGGSFVGCFVLCPRLYLFFSPFSFPHAVETSYQPLCPRQPFSEQVDENEGISEAEDMHGKMMIQHDTMRIAMMS